MNSFLLRFKGYKKKGRKKQKGLILKIRKKAQLSRGSTVLKNGLNF